MTASLRQHIASMVPDRVRDAGFELFSTGAVLDLRVQAKSVEARVANENGAFEQVRVVLKQESVSTSCSCWENASICSHAVAVLLRIGQDAPELFGFHAFAEENGDGEQTPVAEPTPPLDPVVRQEQKRPPLMECLLAERETEARLDVFLVGEDRSLESRWHKLHVRVGIVYAGREYSPSNMKRMLDAGLAAGNMALSEFSPQEQQIMRFLVTHAEQDGADFEMSAHTGAELFHCLIGFSHFHDSRGRIHVHGDHVEPQFVVASRADCPTVTSRLMLPGRGLLPAGNLTLVAGKGGIWIGVEGHYWWSPGMVEPRLLRSFVRQETVDVSPEELRRLTVASDEGRLPATIVHEEGVRELAMPSGACRPVLTLDWEEDVVAATLEFEYDGMRVVREMGTPVWSPDGLLVRDTEAEHAAVDRLQTHGFARAVERPGRYRMRAKEKLWEFIRTGLAELSEDWKVYTCNEFQRKLALSGKLALELATTEEDNVSFELACHASVDGHLSLRWQDVADATRHDLDFITMDDGALVQVPPEVRRVVELLLNRSMAADGERLRFPLHSALVLSDAVAPYATPEATGWRRLREMLTAQHGIPTPKLPAAFRERLRDYQAEGIGWIMLLEQCGFSGVLADEMGLGKTIQALGTIIRRRLTADKPAPTLVVCPTSLIENWLIEARRFVPELKALGIRGLERKHLIARVPQVDLAVTSYALLRRDIDLYQAIDIDYLILDEAQHIKNPDTANARTCKSLQTRHRLVLTGTPLENSAREMWSLFDFLLPGLLGTQREFRRRYGQSTKPEDQERAATDLGATVKPFILRRTKDEVCRQLPPKIEQLVYCHLNAKQQRMHQNLLAAGREMVRLAREEGWRSHRFELLSVIMRLRQLCCHPDLLPGDLRSVEPGDVMSSKTELLKEIILEAIDGGHRILLFSQFTSFLRLLQPWLEEENIAHEYLDGATRDRQGRVDRFNNDDSIPIFLLSLKAGGTGLNLTGADTVIHYDQWWNPMVEDQATDRTHRIGQERPVTVYKLVARHSIEEKILRLQEGKRKLFTRVMEGIPTRVGELSADDFEFIFHA